MKELMKRIWNRAVKSSEPVKASFWFTVCSIINKCIQLITVPIFTRMMTTAEFDKITIFNSFYGVVVILATLSLYSNVFNNGMLKFKEDKAGFQSALQGLTTTISVFLFSLLIVFHETVTKYTGIPLILLVLMMLEVIVMSGFEFWAAGERFDYKYKKVVTYTLVVAVLNPVLGLILVYWAPDESKGDARVLSIVITAIIVYSILYIRNLVYGKKFFSGTYWKYALILAVPLVPHYLSQMLLNEMDRFMIKAMCEPGKAAIYGVAYSAAMVMQIIGKAIQGSLTPWIYRKIEQKDTVSVRGIVNKLCILVAGLNFIVICFAPEAIWILGGGKYEEAIYVIPPVVASCYLIFLYSLFCLVEFYYEQTKPMMVVSVIGAVINYSLNAWLIPIYGFTAAGYTTLISYIFFVIVHYFVMHFAINRHNGDTKMYQISFISLFTLSFIILSVVMPLTYKNYLIRYGIVLTMVIVATWKKKYILSAIKMK